MLHMRFPDPLQAKLLNEVSNMDEAGPHINRQILQFRIDNLIQGLD